MDAEEGNLDAESNDWCLQEKTKSLQNTVNLLTSTVKSDAEEGGEPLKFCFRVVAPDKAYTLQADNEMDRRDWMEAIQVPIRPPATNHLACTSDVGFVCKVTP